MEARNVIHLYLGCQFIGKYKDWAHENNVMTLCWKDLEPNKFEYIKPILRPLSSMTEEEKPEWNQRKQRKGYMAQIHADNTLWLLSKGFDLFGLIQSGHALDLTSQPEGNTVNMK